MSLDLIIFLTLLLLGYGFGTWAEKRHYRSILAREDKYKKMMIIAGKRIPKNLPVGEGSLVMGSVVISIDYFKKFIASLRKIIGGRVTSFENLVDRARREAILRMKEEADAMGAKVIFNVKIETSSISKGRKNAIGSVEVLAYGTALMSASAQPEPESQEGTNAG